MSDMSTIPVLPDQETSTEWRDGADATKIPPGRQYHGDPIATASGHWHVSDTDNLDVPKSRPLSRRAERKLKEWEGYVVAVASDSFLARLSDISELSASEDIEAKIPLDEVDPAQIRLVKEGAVFRWVISYVSESGRPRYRNSVLMFRELPRTESKLPRQIETIFDDIKWE